MGHYQNMFLTLYTMQAHGTEGGDSLGISEQLETPQERSFGRRKRSDRSVSDEEAQGSPPQKASACSEMCCQVLILV